jgi:hypothetical protein
MTWNYKLAVEEYQDGGGENAVNAIFRLIQTLNSLNI